MQQAAAVFLQNDLDVAKRQLEGPKCVLATYFRGQVVKRLVGWNSIMEHFSNHILTQCLGGNDVCGKLFQSWAQTYLSERKSQIRIKVENSWLYMKDK